MIECLKFLLEVVVVICVTDFASGLLHWLEDSYGRESWLITGSLVTVPNIIHHHQPRYFTRHNWLKSADILLALGAIILAIAFVTDSLTWHVLLFVVLGVNANEIHKWAHQTTLQRPRIATWLQKAKILQTPRHHARHHTGGKDTHYCVITNLTNLVLERLRFWRVLEYLALVVFGAKKRDDRSVSIRGKVRTIG